jgi:hypothetical protein
VGTIVSYDITEILIPKENVAACLKALNDLFIGGKSYRWIPPRTTDFTDLVEAIESWGFDAQELLDQSESVVIESFANEKLGDEAVFFRAIAPFVQGPTRVLGREEDNYSEWEFRFENGTVTETPCVKIFTNIHDPERFLLNDAALAVVLAALEDYGNRFPGSLSRATRAISDRLAGGAAPKSVLVPGAIAVAVSSGRPEFLAVMRHQIADGADTISKDMAINLIDLIEKSIVDNRADQNCRNEVRADLSNMQDQMRGLLGMLEKCIESLDAMEKG